MLVEDDDDDDAIEREKGLTYLCLPTRLDTDNELVPTKGVRGIDTYIDVCEGVRYQVTGCALVIFEMMIGWNQRIEPVQSKEVAHLNQCVDDGSV